MQFAVHEVDVLGVERNRRADPNSGVQEQVDQRAVAFGCLALSCVEDFEQPCLLVGVQGVRWRWAASCAPE